MPSRSLPWAALLIAGSLPGLSGCLLAEQDCGVGFVFQGDRCVPATAPDPFYPDRDGAVLDGAPTAEPEPEAEPPPPPDLWAPYRIALLIDRTSRASAGRTPASPGADIDAVQVVEPTAGGDTRIGVGREVLGALFNDPFDANLNTDPRAVIGLPDGQVASLGVDGGFVYLALDLERPMRVGDVIVVSEVAEGPGDEDRYALYLCRTPDSIQDCRSPGGGGPGITRFTLE